VALKDRIATMPVLGTAWTMQQRYRLDGADQFAAAIALFGFISLVPLLLLAAAVAGFVWTDPDDQARIAVAITEAIPGLGAALDATGEGAEGFIQGVVDNRGALAGFGAVSLLLTGLKVINSGMVATTMVFRAPLPSGAAGKIRQVVALPVLGIVALAAAAGSSLVGWLDLPGWLATPAAFAVTYPLDLLLFLAAYRMFSPTSELSIRRLLPGAALGALGWAALKIAGAAYVSGQAEDANALYGAFGGIIALLLLLYLAGRLYLYGAELTAVFAEREGGLLISPETHGVPLADEADLSTTPTSAEGEGRAAAHDLDERPTGRRSDGRPVLQDVAAGRAGYAATSSRTGLHPDAPETVPVREPAPTAGADDVDGPPPAPGVATAPGRAGARPAGSTRDDAAERRAAGRAGAAATPAWKLRQDTSSREDAGGRDPRTLAAYGFAAAAVAAAVKLARDGR
jgi:YihY family inner membrane protein